MRTRIAIALMFLFSTVMLAQVIKGGGTAESESQTTSGLTGTLTFKDALGTRTNQFEMIVNGGPATVAVTISGCMPGGTCVAQTSTTSITNTTLYVFNGPFSSYQIAYTLTGGASPTLAFNRLASVSSLSAIVNAAFSGLATLNNSPLCIVDGFFHTSIGNPDIPHNCVDDLANLGVTGTGHILSRIPEDLIPNGKQPFIHVGQQAFSGLVELGNSLGPGATNACTTSLPFTCWMVSYPVILPSGLQLVGLDPSQAGNAVNGGTTIAATTTFTQPLGLTSIGTPQVPVCVASGGDGSIPAAGTIFLRASLVSNAMDAPGVIQTLPKTQLRGPSTAESSVALCGANDSITWQIQGTPVRSTGMGVQDIAVYAALASGQNELEVSSITCSTNPGQIDPDGGSCRLAVGGGNITFTILSIAQGNTPPPAPLIDTSISYDLSNPMFLLGQGPDTRNSSAVVLRNLTLMCNPTGSDTFTNNTPSFAVLGFTGNELSGLENVAFYGPCRQGYAYHGYNSNNSHIYGFNAGSSSGPTTTKFTALVCDGRMPSGGCPREIRDGTWAAHDINAGRSDNMILVTGAKAWPTMHSVHTENAGGGCGIRVTNGANAVITMEGHTGGTDTVGTGPVGNGLVCIDGPGVAGGVAASFVDAWVQSDSAATGKTLVEDASIPGGFGNTLTNNVYVLNNPNSYGSDHYSTKMTIQAMSVFSLIFSGIPFANLGTPANGTVRFCSDCNATCAAGGSTGRTCFRENGAWVH